MPPAILECNIIGTDEAFMWMHQLHSAFLEAKCVGILMQYWWQNSFLGYTRGLVTIVVCSLVQLGDGKTINIPIGTKTTCRLCWIGDSLGVQYSTWMLQYIYVMYADIDLDFSKYLKVKSIQLRQNYFLKCINRGIF